MVVVKICGMTSVEDALAAVQAGADWIGLNFYPRSPRCVDLTVAERIVASLPETTKAVGVFVNAPREEVEAIARRVGLHMLQFHGDEPPEYCRDWSWPVIKAVRGVGTEVLRHAEAFATAYLLIDAFAPGQYGGTGRVVDWSALATWKAPRPLILAGGLTPDNVATAVRVVAPFAVDVASGVEVAPGRKDRVAMRRFVEHAKAA
ncbi:MAG: phosphoribosylanthranilate isomerase [Dehalococcoidia bacterium]|jgi:phosphoribosylanthranilate isomerase|nr:phosphoribosylanthranilate isomerase [Dehalococcoidia bacterium]